MVSLTVQEDLDRTTIQKWGCEFGLGSGLGLVSGLGSGVIQDTRHNHSNMHLLYYVKVTTFSVL